jgi:hypothetical protein
MDFLEHARRPLCFNAGKSDKILLNLYLPRNHERNFGYFYKNIRAD